MSMDSQEGAQSGIVIWGSGYRVSSSGFRIEALRVRVRVEGFRVWYLELRTCVLRCGLYVVWRLKM